MAPMLGLLTDPDTDRGPWHSKTDVHAPDIAGRLAAIITG